jgi:hypothetical protein
MTFHPCSRWIYAVVFQILSGFVIHCPLAQTASPQIHFLYIGSGLCLGLPPDPGSLRAPLALASGSQDPGPQGTIRGLRRGAPPSSSPMLGAQ